MPVSLVRHALAVSLVVVLVSCGDQSLFMSSKADTADLQIVSVADGQVIGSAKTVPLLVSAQNTEKNRDLEIDVTLTASSGESIWHNRSAAVLNEQSPITLPTGLAAGLYRLDLVLYSSGEIVQKKSASFFIASDGWKITGIRSFPPVITATSTVMLKAELETPPDANPYLRWTGKGKVIASGMRAGGLEQVLWAVPADAGVYTITLELFPSPPPAGSDFPFSSSISLSTDIVVSGGASSRKGGLGPASSFLSLLSLQASLADAGVGARKAGKPAALPIGSPEVVTLENGFGYRLDGSSGIRIPWLALPGDSAGLKPFTVSLGISFDETGSANRVLSAASADGNVSLVIAMNPQTAVPEARLSGGGGAPLIVPWSGPPLLAKQRYLLSLSVVPQGPTLAAQWFLDGVQVSRMSGRNPLAGAKQEGSVTIGGEQGFKGIVDEFGVYYQDPAGRPSTDPDLYARAQARANGNRVAFADGFDGVFLAAGFATEGRAQLAGGQLSLAPGAGVTLPALKPDSSITLAVDLSRDSVRSATLVLRREGSARPPLTVTANADAGGLRLQLAADGLSMTFSSSLGEQTVTLPSAEAGGGSILVKIQNPPGARSSLIIDQVLALKDRW